MSEPLRRRIVSRFSQALARSGMSREELAAECGFKTPRTVQRFFDGESFAIETAEAIEGVLLVDALDSSCQDSGHCRPKRDRSGAPEPVVGWEQAALRLGISARSLRRRRRDLGIERLPWWESEAALREWWARVVARGGR